MRFLAGSYHNLLLIPGPVGFYILLNLFKLTGLGIGWCLLRFNLYNLGREYRTVQGLYDA